MNSWLRVIHYKLLLRHRIVSVHIPSLSWLNTHCKRLWSYKKYRNQSQICWATMKMSSIRSNWALFYPFTSNKSTVEWWSAWLRKDSRRTKKAWKLFPPNVSRRIIPSFLFANLLRPTLMSMAKLDSPAF